MEELAKALKKQGVDMHVTALVSLNLHVAAILDKIIVSVFQKPIQKPFLIITSAF